MTFSFNTLCITVFNRQSEFCIFIHCQSSNIISCKKGLRQEENSSTIIFYNFLNDRQSDLIVSNSRGIELHYSTAHQRPRLLVLLQADDTLILFQRALS